LIKTQNRKIEFSILIVSILAIFLLFAIDIAVGSADITLKEFVKILFGNASDHFDRSIVFKLRFPRAISAILVGAGLSLAGLLLQTLFHNPLAGPYVLGISSGASLGVATYVLTAATIFSQSIILTYGGQLLAALIGSGLVFLIILMVSWKINNTISLLIIGIMIGSMATAIIGILQYFSSAEKVHRFVVWSLGSLDGIDWDKLYFMIPLILVMIGLSVLVIKPLNAMLMGDNNAQLSGVNVKRTRIYMIIISSVLAGVITAYAGPIAFIGMTVPHIVRLLTKKANFYVLLPGVIVIGAILMLVCDIISQLPGQSFTLPINSVTAMFGAPLVIILIFQNRTMKSNF
jgi:iron complex transport system permease protein